MTVSGRFEPRQNFESSAHRYSSPLKFFGFSLSIDRTLVGLTAPTLQSAAGNCSAVAALLGSGEMNAHRERHNAKARQSTAGSRKKGKRKATSTIKEPDYDPNAEIISLKSDEQKELDRRERLRQEVRSLHLPSKHGI